MQLRLKSAKENKGTGPITRVPINSIKLWKDNPRKNDASVPRLAKLLEEHGQRSPIVVWGKNHVIYKGNTTWRAAKSLGWTHIDAIVAYFPSEQAAIAYGIADNVSSEWADWDDDMLQKFLKVDEIDLGKTGFSQTEVNRIFSTIFDKVEDVDGIGEYDEESDFFTIKILDVKPSDKDSIVSTVNSALEGTGYVAKGY